MANKKKFHVTWKAISKKTGNSKGSGGMYIEAVDNHEAEGLALAELNRRPPVQSTEGIIFEVKASY